MNTPGDGEPARDAARGLPALHLARRQAGHRRGACRLRWRSRLVARTAPRMARRAAATSASRKRLQAGACVGLRGERVVALGVEHMNWVWGGDWKEGLEGFAFGRDAT